MEKVTKEQIEGWKKKYGQVFHIKFEDGKQCYLRKPDRKIVSLSQSKTSTIDMVEVFLLNCWLAGDPEIKDDKNEAGYHIFLGTQLDKIVGTKLGEIKNC